MRREWAGAVPSFQKNILTDLLSAEYPTNKELIRCVILSRIIFGEEHWKCAQALASLAYGYLTLRGTWFPQLGLGGPARESQTKPTHSRGGGGGGMTGGESFLPPTHTSSGGGKVRG